MLLLDMLVASIASLFQQIASLPLRITRMKKVAVAGGAGFIGSNLTQLIDRGIRILDCTNSLIGQSGVSSL